MPWLASTTGTSSSKTKTCAKTRTETRCSCTGEEGCESSSGFESECCQDNSSSEEEGINNGFAAEQSVRPLDAWLGYREPSAVGLQRTVVAPRC